MMWYKEHNSDSPENAYAGGCVSHATMRWGALQAALEQSSVVWRMKRGLQPAFFPVVGLFVALLPKVALAADPTCVNYYTIGESDCRPAASTPISKQLATPPQLLSPKQPQSEVDKYLENYGKPPREFVEFYLNPTPENAAKWVQTYQGMLKKGQDISDAWGHAEELYNATPGVKPATLAPIQAVPAQVEAPAAVAPSDNAPAPTPPTSIGAFAASSEGSSLGASGVRQSQVSLTYYFSQTCPYCARMTPDLSILSKELSGKLVFTCVDVTPLGPTSGPNESFITTKLPCKWRLPDEGEVAQQNVAQTPTLIIQKEGGAPLRLSGYVPLAQLRTYFQ